MAVLLRVAPWILFGLGQLIFGRQWASPFGAITAIVIIAAGLSRGHKMAEMILDSSTVVYFAGFSVLTSSAPHSQLVQYVAAGAQLFHAAVIGAFLLGKTPFTLPIARRSVPPDVAKSDYFYRFNARLTTIWFSAFVLSGVVLVGMVATGLTNVPAQIAIIVAAIIVPALLQRRMIRRAAPASAE